MSVILETERLIFRPLLIDDVDILFKIDSNPNIHEYLWKKPTTDINQTKFIINSIQGQYLKHKIGRYGIVLKETNELIGWGGLKFNENMVNNHTDFYDIGICLDESQWNKKLGFEIFHTWVKYFFENMNLPKVYAYTQINNSGSNKLAEKIGMRLKEDFFYENENWNWYEMGLLTYQMLLKKGLLKDIELKITNI